MSGFSFSVIVRPFEEGRGNLILMTGGYFIYEIGTSFPFGNGLAMTW
jgi:hypothetical protein